MPPDRAHAGRMEGAPESLFEWVTRALRDPDPPPEFARLGVPARRALDEGLAPEENVRVVIRGTACNAVVGTDTRVLVVSEAGVSSWPYVDVIGVELDRRVVGGSVVLRVPGGAVEVPAAGDWDVIRARVATLRGLIAGARSDAVPAERHLVAL